MTLFLDGEGLTALFVEDRRILALVDEARREGVRVATTAMTVVEADPPGVHPARIRWVLSQIDVHDVTRDLALRASSLLRGHGLRGHRLAIDAVLAVTAQHEDAPAAVVTSDPKDLALLCGPSVEIIRI
jgi:predicted nucleic acid-binding protein